MTRPIKKIPYGRQWITANDIREVVSALKSDWLTQGPKVAEFEAALASYCGSRYAVTVSSGTAALHIACLALGLDDGDGVVTSPNTFVASANCAVYCGQRPYFVDIDPDAMNMDPVRLREFLEGGAGQGRIKAIIPVHFAGHPCDMKAIAALAKEHGLKVIEDGCHALGAGTLKRGNKLEKVGSCRYSDMTVFSFHPVKHITTGEGGAVLTNDKTTYNRLLRLRSHGITRDAGLLTQNPGPWYYEMHELGFNYRLTDIQSALGISQLKKLDGFVSRRREIAARYDEAFSGMEHVRTPVEKKGAHSSYHLYPLRVDFSALGLARADAMRTLSELGILTQVHYIPVHFQPFYRRSFGYRAGDFPVAEAFYEQTLSIPMFPAMTDAEVARVIKAVRKTFT